MTSALKGIAQSISDATTSISDKLRGEKRYHNNLLGESLQDLLRKATAKTLDAPDEETNQLVVETILQEVSNGRDSREVVNLLKQRLRMDNPYKQYLAVVMMRKVMADCQDVLGLHQEELLQEVARVMARPAKPETDAGKKARKEAKELLRSYGRAAATAFRNVNQEGMPRNRSTVQPYTATGVPYDAGTANIEKQSLIDEVNLLIDKAKSNTELLSDMLVNSSGAQDDFESELIRDLLNEVKELRDLFTAYLEQLQMHDGAEIEVLVVQALEAADMLDGAIALQKDVAANQQDPSFAAAVGKTTSPTAAGSSPAAPTTPAPAPKRNDDLIALDDLADALTAPTSTQQLQAGIQPAHDPFAASWNFFGNPPPQQQQQQQQQQTPAGQLPGQGPAAPGMTSAFQTMFSQPGSSGTYHALAATAAPTPYPGGMAPNQQQQPPQQQALPPTPGYSYSPGPQQQSPFPLHNQQPYPAHSYPPMQQQQFSSQLQPSFQSPPAAAHNPFAVPTPSQAGITSPAGSVFLPMAPGAASNNPFAAAGTAAAGTASAAAAPPSQSGKIDQEWDLFFADRAAGAQAPQGNTPSNTQPARTDFDLLMAKPAGAH